MLRFPLRTKLTLITTAGVITAQIIRATDEFVYCKDVEYQDLKLGKLYIDRNAIIGFSDFYDDNKLKEKNIKDIIKSAKILNFNDYLHKTKEG